MMNDLNPRPVKVSINGKEYEFQFTFGRIAEIQASCDMPIFDAVKTVARVADRVIDADSIVVFEKVVTVLSDGDLTKETLDACLSLDNCKDIGWAILNAYGFSMPEGSDESKDNEEEKN